MFKACELTLTLSHTDDDDEDDEDEEAGDMDQFMADDEIEETDTKVSQLESGLSARMNLLNSIVLEA